jgi:hypothetical protein
MGNANNNMQPTPSLFQRVFRWGARIAEKEGWSNPFMIAMLAGLLTTVMVTWKTGFEIRSIAVSLFVALSSVACGGLLGFLFGIPRAAAGDGNNPPPRYEWQLQPYTANTNLEQISDWLTKIVVAIGLAQLAKIPGDYQSLATYVSAAFYPDVVSPSLAALMLAYFGILGFLMTYLWTRLFLSGEFNKVDGQASRSPAFLEGLIEALLYQAPPEGYTKALTYAEQYRTLFGDQNWRIWRSVACGYGQLYNDLSAADKQGPKGHEAHDKALDAVKRVLNLSPQQKRGLFALWDRATATPQEDDLTPFADDPEFRAVLTP